jgi:hypothetical protein
LLIKDSHANQIDVGSNPIPLVIAAGLAIGNNTGNVSSVSIRVVWAVITIDKINPRQNSIMWMAVYSFEDAGFLT